MANGVGRVSDIVVTGSQTPQVPSADGGAPVLTTPPSISAATGLFAGRFSAIDGVASNVMSFARSWWVDGKLAGKGRTITLATTAGSMLVLQVIAYGPNGQTVVVNSAPVALGVLSAITIDTLVTRSGTVYTHTARRSGDLGASRTATVNVGPSTLYQPTASASDFPGAVFPTISIAFPAGSATTTFSFDAGSAQPE